MLKSGIGVELREILLKDKPPEMIAISNKGTVPVLQLADGKVIDESTEVIQWALAQHDPDNWCTADPELSQQLIEENDGSFKTALDRYKYFTRHPEHPQEYYRAQGEMFIKKLEALLALQEGKGLVRPSTSLADIAIFPFVRQFAGVDAEWFANAGYPLVCQWLYDHLNAPEFLRIMIKYPLWLTRRMRYVERWHEPGSD